MARHTPPFSGIWPAMITPYDDADRVNLEAARKLTQRFIEEGAGGLYVCGSTGEAPLLTVDERKSMTECVIQEVNGRVPVVIHVGHTSPINAVELAKHAGASGADAISSVPPPFFGYTPDQIAGYWTELSDASQLPFYGYVLNDIGGTVASIQNWVDRMLRVPRLVGVKFSHTNMYQLSMLKICSEQRLNVFSGYDESCLAARAAGADGAIGSTYNIALPAWRRAYELLAEGRSDDAVRQMQDCARIVGHLASNYFHTLMRHVLKRQGIDCGLPRPPLRADQPIPEGEIDVVFNAIEAAQRDCTGVSS